MVAGIGNRFGWWDFHTGIRFLKWAAYGEAATIAGSLISLGVAAFKSKSALLMSLIGTIIGLTALAIPASMWMIAHRVPSIHDITTDTENPPKFVAVVKLLHDASNPVE